MDQILSQLENIANLSDAELDALKSSIVKEFKSVDKSDTSPEVIDTINQLADAADAIKAERTRREQEATELASAREAAAARIIGDEGGNDAEVEDDIDPETGKKRKKKAEESEVAPVAEASVNAPEESEFGVTQPAVQPEGTETGFDKPDAEYKDQAEVEAEITESKTNKTSSEVEERGPDREVADAEDKTETEDKASEEAAAEDEVAVEEDKSEDDASEEENKEEDSEETVTAAAQEPVEVPADRRPNLETVEVASAPVTITAGANIPGFEAGSTLSNLDDVANALVNRMRKLGATNPGADGEQITVASFSTSYPEERTLSSADKGSNTEKVQAVVNPSAITAAGGVCAPVEVRYDVFSFNEETGRPVRDALAVFSADRGGIRFVTPPTLEDLDGAVSTWTRQDDVDAIDGTPTKPCLRVDCGQEVVVYTDAIPLCLTFGNLGARAYPELVARHTELGMVWHARYAETRLLTRIGALSTAVSTTVQLGAARDFFVALEKAAAGYRNRYRLSSTTNLRVLLPEWFRNALRADVTKQLPGDGQDVTFNLSDATINSYFAARNVNVSWFIDGEAGQVMGNQAAGAINEFPSNLVWYLFSEGTFLFLDGGTLDLGLVRDSQLNGTNDYKIFLETFEGVAKIGIESLKITTPVALRGAAAATVNTTA